MSGRKYFTIATGETSNVKERIQKTLHEQISQLHEVSNEEESEAILIFCPIISSAENDIQATLQRLNQIPDFKLVILFILHHTSDPERFVSESSVFVTRKNTITVNCLFHNDKGLLNCCPNTDALLKVIECLNTKVPEPSEEEVKRLKKEIISLRHELTEKDKLLQEKDALLSHMAKQEKGLHDVSAKLGKITALQEEHYAQHSREKHILVEMAEELKSSKQHSGVSAERKHVLTQTSVQEKSSFRKIKSMEAIPPIMGGELCSVKSSTTVQVPELRLVLLGRTGSGKSAVGNVILGREEKSQTDTSTERQQSESRQGEVAGRQVTVVDTPDWFCPGLSLGELRQDVGHCVHLSAPGPHAFLLVLPVKQSTGEERGMLEKMEEIFGERCWRNTIILFTVTDEVQEKNAEEFIRSGTQEVQRLVEKCGKRFHCLNIKESGDSSQVSKLMEKIEEMLAGNRGAFYSSEIYQETESQIRAMRKIIMQEREEKTVNEKRELKRKLENERQNFQRQIDEQIQGYKEDIRQLNDQATELERMMKKETDVNKKRKLEETLEVKIKSRIEIEKNVRSVKERREKERIEVEERHRQDRIIMENYEKVNNEAERNIMNIVLPEFWRNIFILKSEMQELRRQMEEKDKEIEALKQRVSELEDCRDKSI